MVLRIARQDNITLPESTPPVRSATRKGIFSNTTASYFLSTERERKIFSEGWGRGWDSYLFSKFDKWRRGVHIKFMAETVVSSMRHDNCFMNLGKGRNV